MQRLKEYVESFNITGQPLNEANGFFGYTAYDCVRYFDKVEITKRDKELASIPDMKYVLYRFVIRVNISKTMNGSLRASDSGRRIVH